ncbi:MAG TPA: glycosyltransferase [Thermomicrobiales bacterium]|nr:glycosyltransferase [Thermomicrobiales bacterium]
MIPARNEERAIVQALDALRGQVDLTGRPLTPDSFDVTVLASNCEDDTATVVTDYAERFPTFRLRMLERTTSVDQTALGAAQRSLIEDACARFDEDGHEGIVASTDAHTTVAPDWIAATLAEFAQGADAVGGRIVLAPADLARLTPEQRRMYLQNIGYSLMLAELGARVDPNPSDPSPCHHQHFGASLAVRTDVYRRADVSPEAANHDAALYDALQQVDASIRHSPRVRVTTSTQRLTGGWEEWSGIIPARRPVLVEPVARSLERLQLRRELRGRWRFRHAHAELAQGTRMDAFACFGAFLADVRSEIEHYLDETAGNEPVPLAAALGDLRMALAAHHRATHPSL